MIQDEGIEQAEKQVYEAQLLSENAKVLLDNPVIKDFIEGNIDRLFQLLDTIPLSDKASRERVYDMIWLFKKFDQKLKSHVEFGEESVKKWNEVLEIKRSMFDELKDKIFG